MAVHYERLSTLDNSFLALESRTTHMHVGSVAIFDSGSFAKADGGIDVQALRDFVESKLHMIPRYRQRLAWVPLEQHPVWVDDEHFSIEYHVRHIGLPRPGTDKQLKQIAGRLMSQQLDRSKPMWEMIVVEGLSDDRFAIVAKIHHCMIDGLSGVDLMAVLMSPMPVVDIIPGPIYEPRPVPNGTELLVRETTRRVTESVSALRNMPHVFGNAIGLADTLGTRLQAVGASLGSGWLVPTGKTGINGPIGPGRRFEWVDTPLQSIKDVKNTLGGTVNDVLLAIVSGAVRRFLIEHRDATEQELADTEFRVMAPVSVRTKDQRGTLGNQVAMWLAALPLGDPDPASRLATIHEETQRLKETNQALGASTLVRLSGGAPATLVALGARLAANARPFNMTVTNVPGPQFPLYMRDARLRETYPLVPLWESHGIGIAMFSYDGSVAWGINGDYQLMPDLDRFGDSILVAFDELVEAAKNPPAPKKKPTKKRAAAKKEPAAKKKSTAKKPPRPKKRPPIGTP